MTEENSRDAAKKEENGHNGQHLRNRQIVIRLQLHADRGSVGWRNSAAPQVSWRQWPFEAAGAPLIKATTAYS